LSAKDPKAPIIAEAIMTFQMNNRSRTRLGLKKKDLAIPCIIMAGIRPISYVAPVTQQLRTAVEKGKFHEHVTEISILCSVPLPKA
ncbi:hypothetical protein BC827DRAFT_1118052, partial [Russula dissimulans]